MKTDMVVSCPKCAVENKISMEHKESGGLIGLLGMVLPGVKQYTFCGKAKCICGETINAVLTVGSGKEELMGI